MIRLAFRNFYTVAVSSILLTRMSLIVNLIEIMVVLFTHFVLL